MLLATTYSTSKPHNRKISEPDIDKLLIDKFKDFKAPLTASVNMNKNYIPITEKINPNVKKTPSTSERVTLDQKLKQYSKYEKKSSTNKNEDFNQTSTGYNPINTEASPFMVKKKTGKNKNYLFVCLDDNIKTHYGPFDIGCLSFKSPTLVKDDILKVLLLFKIAYKSYTVIIIIKLLLLGYLF